MKKNKGITLIALVITIIVLMILAGVTINMVLNGGILEQSQKATQEYKKAQIKEELEQEILAFQAQTYQNKNRSATLEELEGYFKLKGYPTLMQKGLQVASKLASNTNVEIEQQKFTSRI